MDKIEIMTNEINQIKTTVEVMKNDNKHIKETVGRIETNMIKFIDAVGKKLDKKAEKGDLEKTDKKFSKFQVLVYGSVAGTLFMLCLFLADKLIK